MMEKLQIAKYRFRNDRLTFTDDLLCTEEELSVIDLEPDLVKEMLESGRITELQEYIEESWKGWGNEKPDPDDDSVQGEVE